MAAKVARLMPSRRLRSFASSSLVSVLRRASSSSRWARKGRGGRLFPGGAVGRVDHASPAEPPARERLVTGCRDGASPGRGVVLEECSTGRWDRNITRRTVTSGSTSTSWYSGPRYSRGGDASWGTERELPSRDASGRPRRRGTGRRFASDPPPTRPAPPVVLVDPDARHRPARLPGQDAIQKTLTSHDGPFSWEGKYYTHRHVNIWPPVYQRPHPPMWAATGDPETSAELGRRGMVNALVLRGPEASKRAFDTYRTARRTRSAGARDRSVRLCRSLLCRRYRRGRFAGRQQDFVVPQHEPQTGTAIFAAHAGRQPPEVIVQNYRTQPRPGAQAARRPADSLIRITAEQAIARGILRGNPDTVYKQIMDIYDKVAGPDWPPAPLERRSCPGGHRRSWLPGP